MISGDDIAPRFERHPVKALQLALGTQLRSLFEPVVQEPLPAEFLARLDRLDEARRPGEG
jgi:hypothetical protein